MPTLAEDLRFRGLVHQVTDPELLEILDRERLTVYVGFDPSAPSLHVGNLIGVTLLRRFQLAGHRVIALVGGGTGMIGDPGGRQSERALLEPEELRENARAVAAQLGRLLDLDGEQGCLLDNAEWLGSLGLVAFLRDIGKHFSANELVAKEFIRRRLTTEGQSISFTEFSYPLLQAYDFLQLSDRFDCRVQAGGSDQWGNITAGVDLVRRVRSRRVFGLTTPLLLKADGTKAGKTAGGALWLDGGRTSPWLLHQALLRTDDAVVGHHLRLLTFLDHDELKALDEATTTRPAERRAQRALAREVTAMVHGEDAARGAERAAEALFSGDLAALPEEALVAALAEAPSSHVPRARVADGWPVVDALVESGLVASRSAARRALREGSVRVSGRVERDEEAAIGPADLLHDRYLVLRRGRAQHLVTVEG